MKDPTDRFSSETMGLEAAVESKIVRLGEGDLFELRIGAVAKRIGDADVRMLAYNGSVPGPSLHVTQGSEIQVKVTNEADHETTVHWHGLRLENRFDGVPHETQAPIPIGASFTYSIRFPDAGVFWYHPHIREDYAQEMGLYGTIVVQPSVGDYWPPVNREVALTLDDVLVQDGRIAPFSRRVPDHTAMGRYGNVFLVNGSSGFAMDAATGEVVRLYLVNTANARVFNVRLAGARMKLVGGDNGRYEREEFVDEVLLSPSERAVVDVLFEGPGKLPFELRTPDRVETLFWVSVSEDRVTRSLVDGFDTLRRDPRLRAERARIEGERERAPDRTLAMVGIYRSTHADGPSASGPFTCPMHPDVRSEEPGTCPKCGMRLLPDEGEVPAEHADHGGSTDGIEWEDSMLEMNRASTPGVMRWKIVDQDTGSENARIDWSFKVGERVKIRLSKEIDSDHPMHHPFHVHGAGAFLVLSRDGVPEPNLVWKDTVLVRRGEIVDILLDVTNPGLWMAHCHIAEHIESGMMFSFRVDR
jgi:FtsP/CotA-like multicopper oxidase with cupredoxin domain